MKKEPKSIREFTDWAVKNRIRFWKKVRQSVVDRIEQNRGSHAQKIGLCWSIDAVRGMSKDFHSIRTYDNMPEFLAQKPKNCWPYSRLWWWNPYEHKTRLKRVKAIDNILAQLEAEKQRRGI